jgi:hypothetical protein
MPERTPRSAAQALYPHLQSGARNEVEQRRPSLAEAMYPRPQPKKPKRQMTAEEVRDFWANVDPAWARSIGLVPKGTG